MGAAGYLKFDTKLDTNGFKKGISDITGSAKQGGGTIKNIVAGLGITKLIGKGIDIIRNSLDGAISRFDTMNNFPKVMENLGVSTKESEKAIKELSDGITGLPTTLDDAALAVEKFTSANSDVEKSTKIFLAANDAIVAGGASADIQKNAMEQLSQAYAKGKPDMMEWRSLQTAMPGQLKQVATAMGYAGGNVADLGEDLRKGNVSMDKFMDTIIKLDKEGLPGFKSFADQAQDSVGGIGTSMTNAKTAVVRGVTNMITALNNGMKKAKMGSIAENISKLGKKAEEVLKDIGKYLERIPFDKVINAVKKLIPLIGALVAGMIAYNAALKVMAAINAAKMFISMLNPIGLAVGAIGGLIAIFALLKQANKDAKTEVDKTNASLANYKNTMDEAKQAREEYVNTNMSEVNYYQSLYNELELLTDENGKVKAGYEERAKFIVGELNNALGTEIKMTGNVIKNYQDLKDKIYEVIEAKRAEVMMNAHEQEYNDAIANRDKLFNDYADALSSTNKLEEDRKNKLADVAKYLDIDANKLKDLMDKNGQLKTDKVENYRNAWSSVGKNIDVKKSREAVEQYNKLNEQLDKSNTNLKNARTYWEDGEKAISDYETALGYMSQKNYDAVLQVYTDTSVYEGKTTEDKINNINKRIEAEQDYINQLKTGKYQADEDYVNSETTKHQKVIDELNKAKEQYKTAAESEQATIKGVWNQGMRDLVKDLTGYDVQFKRTANGQIQMYINGVAEGKPMSNKKAKEVADGVVKELNKAKKGGKIAGTDVIKGVEDGIDYRKGSAFSKIASFGASLLKSLKASLKEKSPSRATREMGINLDKGIIEGIDQEKASVFKKVNKFGNEIIDKMQTAVALETGNINASATLRANYGQTIVINSKVESDVYMDKQKVGQAVTPVVSKTLKKAGVK